MAWSPPPDPHLHRRHRRRPTITALLHSPVPIGAPTSPGPPPPPHLHRWSPAPPPHDHRWSPPPPPHNHRRSPFPYPHHRPNLSTSPRLVTSGCCSVLLLSQLNHPPLFLRLTAPFVVLCDCRKSQRFKKLSRLLGTPGLAVSSSSSLLYSFSIAMEKPEYSETTCRCLLMGEVLWSKWMDKGVATSKAEVKCKAKPISGGIPSYPMLAWTMCDGQPRHEWLHYMQH
ncbi:uncharacterized protein LOC119345082 [Triticum dicoccoides]|uniref:uncharacterized protein LOC119345082 n=1 Tax=Triticum dicoccoides TaxID=85692 RepID=UPI00188FF54B|nr:uncharacterized protein LOC119345082 [Triticum dicoccoides]